MASEYRDEVEEAIRETLGELDVMTCFTGDYYDNHLDAARSLISLGIRLGQEAAAAAVEDTEVVTYTFAGVLHEDGAMTLGHAQRAIRSLSPTDILKAKGGKL